MYITALFPEDKTTQAFVHKWVANDRWVIHTMSVESVKSTETGSRLVRGGDVTLW